MDSVITNFQTRIPRDMFKKHILKHELLHQNFPPDARRLFNIRREISSLLTNVLASHKLINHFGIESATRWRIWNNNHLAKYSSCIIDKYFKDTDIKYSVVLQEPLIVHDHLIKLSIIISLFRSLTFTTIRNQ